MTTYPQPSDPVSALTRPDGTTEAHSVDHGRVIGLLSNAMHHGAVGDGVTNDYAAILAAAAEAAYNNSYCYLPKGTYKFGDGQGIAVGSQQIYRGAGIGKTVVSVKDAYAFTSAGGQNIEISDMTIQLRAGSTAGGFLALTPNSNNVRLRNVTISGLVTNLTPLVDLNGGISIFFDNVAFVGNGGDGLYIDPTGSYGCNIINVRNCRFTACDYGIQANANLLTVAGCDFEGNGSGIRLNNGVHAVIDSSWFEGNGNYNIRCQSAPDTVITNNKFHYLQGTPQYHIAFNGAVEGLTVIGNRFHDSVTGSKVAIDANAGVINIFGNTKLSSGDVTGPAAGTIGQYNATVMYDYGPNVINLGTSRFIMSGSGSPEGAVTASVGALFLRTNGGAGTTLYVKESGTGNTGWVGK